MKNRTVNQAETSKKGKTQRNFHKDGNKGMNKKQNAAMKQKNFRGFFRSEQKKIKTLEDDFIMSPKVDFAFKELMKNETVRIGFISAMLDIPVESIKSTKLLDTHLRKQYEEDKQGILDVRICMNDNTEIDIEIQLAKVDVWAERSIFYLSKMYTDEIKKGKKYSTAHKCICISVLDFILFSDYKGYYSVFHIWEDTRREQYTDKIEFHVIELPKLAELKNDMELKQHTTKMKGTEKREDLKALWGLFMNAQSKEEFTMLAKKNSFLSAAFEHLQLISYSERKRQEYDARERAMLDHDAFMTQMEKNRKELEANRKELETNRKELETNKKELETNRKELEISKKELEANKKEAEANKKEAEVNKKEAEANKKEAEANKKEAEVNKKEAEANRKRAEEAERQLEELKRQLGKTK